MSHTTSLLVGGLALSLVATGCAGSAQDQEGEAADGMIAQLTFPAEVDATVGGLGNYTRTRRRRSPRCGSTSR
ncbi:MAG: hypothetical protein HY829_01850 [Actinobacteria bacterium]|nr:hypothetical protein [Actinomycetota bacterium]